MADSESPVLKLGDIGYRSYNFSVGNFSQRGNSSGDNTTIGGFYFTVVVQVGAGAAQTFRER